MTREAQTMTRKPREREVKMPPLIKTEWYEGYEFEALRELFGPKFGEWMNGQTMAGYTMPDGREVMIVYRHDLDNYCQGGKAFD